MINRIVKMGVVSILVMVIACSCAPKQEECAEEWFNIGMAGIHEGRYDKAVEAFTRVLEIKPHFVPAHNNRAAARMALGDYAGAVYDYNRALAINPGLAEGYSGRGKAFAFLGRMDHAFSDLNRAVELAPGLGEAYSNRALAHVLSGDRDKAITDMLQAAALDPENTAYRKRLESLKQRVSVRPGG